LKFLILETTMKYLRPAMGLAWVLGLLTLTACQSPDTMSAEHDKMHQQHMKDMQGMKGMEGKQGMQAMPANANQMQHMLVATLTGSKEVPPSAGTGIGSIELALNANTKVLTWTVAYKGLSGPVTAAHFHGPAMAGQNTGVAVPMTGSLESPFVGAVILSDAQMADLTSGQWYVNLHTSAFPNGEIRGQIATAP
jgi:CHRD domain